MTKSKLCKFKHHWMVSTHSLEFLVAHMVPGVLAVHDFPWVPSFQWSHQLLEDQEGP